MFCCIRPHTSEARRCVDKTARFEVGDIKNNCSGKVVVALNIIELLCFQFFFPFAPNDLCDDCLPGNFIDNIELCFDLFTGGSKLHSSSSFYLLLIFSLNISLPITSVFGGLSPFVAMKNPQDFPALSYHSLQHICWQGFRS